MKKCNLLGQTEREKEREEWLTWNVAIASAPSVIAHALVRYASTIHTWFAIFEAIVCAFVLLLGLVRSHETVGMTVAQLRYIKYLQIFS